MPLKEFKARLIPEFKELNVEPKKNILSTALAGELMSTLKGRGIEFEDYRDYTTEDDAERIDWRASQRAQRLLVREYKLEVNFNIFFLLDTSESMLFGSTKKLKCEYAAEVVTSLYHGVLQTGNSVGFGMFSKDLYKIVKPVLGKKQFYMFTREVSNPKNYGGEKNIRKAIQQTLSILDRKSLIFLISDFVGDDATWNEVMKIMASRHEVIGIMIRDPRDYTIPGDVGQLVLEDPFSKETMYVDSKQYKKIYEEYNEKQLRKIRSLFRHNKSSLLELRTNTEFLNPVLQFFRKRGGRWR